jgi:hypothetical protein
MSKYPAAVQRPVDRYQSGALHVAMTARRVVAHTAVSADTPSMHSFFNVSGRATPHFYFGRDGECEQYINTGFRASAVLDGNHDCITFESWDGFPGEWSGGMAPPWTDAQVDAIAHLCAWCNTEHGIPLVQLPSSRPGTEGIGWHRQGIDGNFPSSGLLSGRVDGGEHWSESFGKTCPTDRRIEQIPQVIIPRAIEIVNGEDMPTVEDLLKAKINPNDETVADALRAALRTEDAFATYRKRQAERDARLRERVGNVRAAIDALPAGVTKDELKNLLTRIDATIEIPEDQDATDREPDE